MTRSVSLVVAAVVLLSPCSTRADLLIPTSASDTIHSTSLDDGFFGPLDLGFTFPFFGSTFTGVFFNSNGNLTFGAGFSSFFNVAFPTAGTPPMIAPFWNDLILPPGSLRSNALTPGVFVAFWHEVGFFGTAGSVDAQAILLGPGNPFGLPTGSIIFSYGTVTGANTFFASGATVGLNDGGGTNYETLFPLGIGTSGGLLDPPTAASLSDRSFLFTPDGAGRYTVSEFRVAAIPEPLTALLFGLGTTGIVGWARRRRPVA